MFRILLTIAAISAFLLSISCSTVRSDPVTETTVSRDLAKVPDDRHVSEALTRIGDKPTPEDYTLLASAYINAARRSGDHGLNVSARTAVERALEINPDDPSALRLKASLHLTFHEFREALDLGQILFATSPKDTVVLGVITDAHTQLGNYAEAVDSAQRMVDTKPNSQSYARIAILRGLHGDLSGASEMFKLAALTTDPADAEARAWSLTQLGDLYWRNGRYDESIKAYDEALGLLPNYPNALFGKGRSYASKGDLEIGVKLLSGAVERSPHSYSVIHLGDVMARLGRDQAAQDLYKLADDAKMLGETHDPHRIALFWADHEVNLSQALEIAEADYAELKDVYAADILAWCLYKNGRFAEAREKSREALRIGTRDAVLLYHAGMIEKALGNRTEAKSLLSEALELNPKFDLVQADVAKAALAEI